MTWFYAILKLGIRGFSFLPHGLIRKLGWGMGELWYWLLPVRKKIIHENINLAYREASSQYRKRLVRENLRHYGILFLELIQYCGGKPVKKNGDLIVRNIEYVHQVLAKGRGVIVITAHLGNWEIMGATASLFGVPLSIVARTIHNRFMDSLVNESRRQHKVGVIPARLGMNKILEELKNNHIVGFMLDQSAGGASRIEVPFFGAPAATSKSIALLSERSEAPVIPIWNRRTERGFVTSVGLPIEYEKKYESRDENILHNTKRYVTIIESFVRQQPEQWFWIHRRWKDHLQQKQSELATYVS